MGVDDTNAFDLISFILFRFGSKNNKTIQFSFESFDCSSFIFYVRACELIEKSWNRYFANANVFCYYC